MGRIAGIDFGLKRIGLAISDPNRIIASPLTVIIAEKNSKETVKKILAALKAYNMAQIVVGNPLHLDGQKGFLVDEVNHFVSILKEHAPCEIVLWDERLSSVQADRSLREGDLSRKKRASKVDIVSAAIMLESYLERLRLNS